MSTRSLIRPVVSSWKAQPTMEGAGVRLLRAFGYEQLPDLDPFLLLDVFHSENPEDYRAGFPWHPHRGIETITYLLDGEVEHRDSLNNRGVISAGDVQWMTAGSGILHQEMPHGDARGRLAGFQLWSNIPARGKMMAPRYQEVRASDIAHVTTSDGATVRLIAGELAGATGPVREILTEPLLADVSLPAHARMTLDVPRSHSAFAFVIEGQLGFGAAGEDAQPSAADTLVRFGNGDVVEVTTGPGAARFLVAAGRPLKEPVAWAGPIVMNTREELKAAFRELDEGTFVRHAQP